jgi:hypothetical protein
MRKHQETHLDPQRFKCEFTRCNAAFVNSDELEQHFKDSHEGVKPYTCHWYSFSCGLLIYSFHYSYYFVSSIKGLVVRNSVPLNWIFRNIITLIKNRKSLSVSGLTVMSLTSNAINWWLTSAKHIQVSIDSFFWIPFEYYLCFDLFLLIMSSTII